MLSSFKMTLMVWSKFLELESKITTSESHKKKNAMLSLKHFLLIILLK